MSNDVTITVAETVALVSLTPNQTVAINVTNQPVTLTVATSGPQGVPGVPGAAGINTAFYTHTQSSASAVWTINHNLNGYPTAIVIDSAGSQCEGLFSYPSPNQMVITFTGAFAGTAYVI